MTAATKLSTPARFGLTLAAAIVGFLGAWLALDASLTSGRYWPIHLASGPIFSLAYVFAQDMYYGVLTFVGTALLFALYAWLATTFRSLALLLVIAVAHVSLAVAGIALAVQRQ